MVRTDSLSDPDLGACRILEHEELRLVRGQRSGVVLAVAVHSTRAGPAIGGCRIKPYADWREGVADVLRLSHAMTEKCALAGVPHGGGKAVVMDPEAHRDPVARQHLLADLADAISSLGGRYITGPDVGSTPEDMEVIHALTGGLAFCRPESSGGSGSSSGATARGVLAALEAGVRHRFGRRALAGLRAGVVGFGSVGRLVAEGLAGRGCEVVVSDLNQRLRGVAEAGGLTWTTSNLLTDEVDILVPAAIGGVLSPASVASCRASLIVGPANNQLTDDGVDALLHDRGITWIPDVVASAGGVVYAVCREELGLDETHAAQRVDAIGDTTAEILAEVRDRGTTPLLAARSLAARRRQATS